MPDLGLEVLLKGSNMLRLLQGLWVALRISLIAVVISIPSGLLFGVLMTRKNVVLKAIFRVYLEFIRIMPQLVLLFLFYFSTTRTFGWNLSGETASIIVFVLWGTAEMSDLVRGALISIPKHQYESSAALGLTKMQTYLYVIIPQAVRRLIPLSINLITRMIKTTSLILMIGVVEVLKVAQQIIEANRMSSPNAAFGIYLTVFLLYFIMSRSLISKYAYTVSRDTTLAIRVDEALMRLPSSTSLRLTYPDMGEVMRVNSRSSSASFSFALSDIKTASAESSSLLRVS
mgnify:CR=1 FL=1